MCMFSGPIQHVSGTKIFARALPETGHELLIYSMRLDAESDLAMVLPIPVPKGSPDDAVRFVDMSSCSTFFTYVDALFPQELMFGGAFGAPQPASRQQTLVV